VPHEHLPHRTDRSSFSRRVLNPAVSAEFGCCLYSPFPVSLQPLLSRARVDACRHIPAQGIVDRRLIFNPAASALRLPLEKINQIGIETDVNVALVHRLQWRRSAIARGVGAGIVEALHASSVCPRHDSRKPVFQ
jgi:hypothetical protein